MRNQYRLGIDAGGTFTDFILADRDGGVQLFKAPSTPQDGTLAIRAGLAQIADATGRSPAELIANCDLCINGTTVALNALIERTGVKVGLLCTEGHEDSLEIRLGHKEEGHRYDAHYPPAHMLAPATCAARLVAASSAMAVSTARWTNAPSTPPSTTSVPKA